MKLKLTPTKDVVLIKRPSGHVIKMPQSLHNDIICQNEMTSTSCTSLIGIIFRMIVYIHDCPFSSTRVVLCLSLTSTFSGSQIYLQNSIRTSVLSYFHRHNSAFNPKVNHLIPCVIQTHVPPPLSSNIRQFVEILYLFGKRIFVVFRKARKFKGTNQ